MSFLYPIALLGFIAIPILILIYILKNKYTEQTIASTYIWRLSEKFLKRRRPISKIRGLISLLLQIFAVSLITLVAAHPVLTLAKDANDYLFVLDGSASMRIDDNGTTRFEKAKNEIIKVMDSGVNGDTYSLLFVGDATTMVYESLENKETAIELLNKLDCSYLATDCVNSLTAANNFYKKNSSIKTYLFTDKEYDCENVTLVNVSNNCENYALNDSNIKYSNKNLKVTTNVISYYNNATLKVVLYVDDEVFDEVDVEVEANTLKNISFTKELDSYKVIKLAILNEDSLKEDNETYFYNIQEEHQYTTLIVSDKPYLLNMAIASTGITHVDTVKPEDYRDNMRGYGLYVFDSCSPNILPDDGSVWIFASNKSIEKSGISYQDSIETEKGVSLKYANSTSSVYKQFTVGLTNANIVVKKYVKYGTYRNFTTILSAEGNPVVMAGTNEYGNREVVFGFDIHDSNFSMLPDYLLLVRNLLNYSFPEIINEEVYYTGDTATINMLAEFESVKVVSPLGNSNYYNVNNDTADILLNECGTYQIIVKTSSSEKTFKVYVNYPNNELTNYSVNSYKLEGEATQPIRKGIYDNLIWLFIALAIFCMADWMVYCYEQYQLQ